MGFLEDLWNAGKETFDDDFSDWDPRNWNLGDFSSGLEEVQRAILPDGPLEDFAVGWNRIYTGQVGQDGRPSWEDAWIQTDKTFSGWLPGGSTPELPDFIEDPLKKLGGLVAVAAIAALAIGGGQE